MIFGFLKDKVIDKRDSIHDHVLKTSILDRFLRLIGTGIIFMCIAALLLGGVSVPSGNILKWLIPLFVVLVVLDMLFFRWITAWLWSVIVWVFETIWSVISIIFGGIGDFIAGTIEFIFEIISGFFEFIFTFGGGSKKD